MQDDPLALITTTLDADGVLLAVIDMPARSMNVFSDGMLAALGLLLDRVQADDAVRSVVLTSGKPTFLAGADLAMVRGYCDQAKTATHEQMFALCGQLGRQFVRLENSAKPWVAAVNGIALGGGLELALACRQRIVADDPRIKLGVPEVRWGLLPGAGGTQRLPRMAPFDAALGMLLTGRSITAQQAVDWHIFNTCVPATQLIDTARAAARALHGQAYDPNRKFARLTQADVPAFSETAARELAAQQGVDDERFAHYPAYSAISNSVLQGAHLPLDQATAVEMHQFLRLMFSPVAGRMVNTLFLERLRAERELAPPTDLKIEQIRRGPISAARAAWGDALAKLKLPQVDDAALPIDTLEIITHTGQRQRVALHVLGDDLLSAQTQAIAAPPQAWLCPAGDYGRVLEIVGDDAAGAAAVAALAARLWCLPWRTPGPQAVLPQLHGQTWPALAQTARQLAAAPDMGDPAFFDVAACLAGIAPAYSGGPLTWTAAQVSA